MGLIKKSACSKGFTLIETMMAMAAFSIVALAVGEVVTLMTKAERSASMGAENTELLSLVHQIISQPSSCTANLAGVTLDVAGFVPTPLAISFTSKNPSDPLTYIKGKPILNAQNQFGKIQVMSVSAKAFAQLADTVWLVKIGIVSEKTGSFFGGKNLIGEISTQVQIDATGNVLKCLGDQDLSLALTSDTPELNDKICQVASNGSMVYDPKTKSCVTNSNCFPGSQAAAACPAGTKVSGCDAVGVNDPSTNFLSRPLMSGKIVKGGPPSYECSVDSSTNGSSCDYAVGVDFSAASCRACCTSLSLASS